MKRLALFLAILLSLSTPALGNMGMMPGPGNGPYVVAGCTTPTGNALSEGFEGAGYDETGWSEEGTDPADYPNEDTDISSLGTPPTGSCTYGAYINLTVFSGGYGDGYAYNDHGSAVTASSNDIDIQAFVYLPADYGISDWSFRPFILWGANANDPWSGNMIGFYQTTGSGNAPDQVRIVTSAGTYTSATSYLSVPGWYDVKIHIDYRNTAACSGQECSYVQFDSGALVRFRRDSANGRYLYIVQDCAETDVCKIYYSNIKYDITSRP